MQRRTKSNQKSTAKIISVIITAIVICALAVVPAFADQPSLLSVEDGTSYGDPLTRQAQKDILACAQSQLMFDTIRVYPSTAAKYARMVALYEMNEGRFYRYYAVFVPNDYTSLSINYNTSTQRLTLYPVSTMTLYTWVDSDTGGWQYCTKDWTANAQALSLELAPTNVLYYENKVNNQYVGHDLTDDTTAGTSTLTSNAATSWNLAAQVKKYGLPQNDDAIYTEAQYQAYGTQRYEAGRVAMRVEILEDPNEYNLFTDSQMTARYNQGISYVQSHPDRYGLYTTQQYNQSYSSGYNVGYIDGAATSGNVTLDIPDIINGVTNGVASIWSGFMLNGTTIFGISLATVCGALILVTVVVWFINKVR